MTLHIIQSSNFQTNALSNCLEVADDNDTILLIHDATYACISTELKTIKQTVFALEDDLLSRGIAPSHIIEVANYDNFVQLTATCGPCVNWG